MKDSFKKGWLFKGFFGAILYEARNFGWDMKYDIDNYCNCEGFAVVCGCVFA